MSKFIKLTLKFVSFLCITIFLVFLIFTFNYRSYNDYHYNSPEEFFNSESFSWYVNIFPKSANNIFLRAFIETNEMIVVFDVNKTDEIPISQFYKVASIDRGMAFLKDVNIPGSKKQYFLEGGNLNLYCYIKYAKALVQISGCRCKCKIIYFIGGKAQWELDSE